MSEQEIENLREYGIVITSALTKFVFKEALKQSTKLLPKYWINKKCKEKFDLLINYNEIPFNKEKFIINIDMPYIINKDNLKKLSFYLSFKNFNYLDIILEKIIIEIRKDAHTVFSFNKTFARTEISGNYNWEEYLNDSQLNCFMEYFIKYPDDNSYISKGEFDFNFKVFYKYLNEFGNFDLKLNKSIFMAS
ncbi:MAG: hypothetical protein RO257_03255 [Candidatus Kapabacteria bacterium]|nr:hypothetical protein [Candidatus Kapabacteria bacterium]